MFKKFRRIDNYSEAIPYGGLKILLTVISMEVVLAKLYFARNIGPEFVLIGMIVFIATLALLLHEYGNRPWLAAYWDLNVRGHAKAYDHLGGGIFRREQARELRFKLIVPLGGWFTRPYMLRDNGSQIPWKFRVLERNTLRATDIDGNSVSGSSQFIFSLLSATYDGIRGSEQHLDEIVYQLRLVNDENQKKIGLLETNLAFARSGIFTSVQYIEGTKRFSQSKGGKATREMLENLFLMIAENGDPRVSIIESRKAVADTTEMRSRA